MHKGAQFRTTRHNSHPPRKPDRRVATSPCLRVPFARSPPPPLSRHPPPPPPAPPPPPPPGRSPPTPPRPPPSPTAPLPRPIIRYTQTKDGFPDAPKAALVLSVPRPHFFVLPNRRHLRTTGPGGRHRRRGRRHRRRSEIVHQRLWPGGTKLRRQGGSRQSHL